MQHINKYAFRNDSEAKVTGKAKYTDDLKINGMLHAVPVYSDYVHAKILSIITSDAEKVDGVKKIITYKDITGNNRFGQIIKDLRIFADDKIRYNGDVIALVVAQTRETAIIASKLVKLEAEELPSVLDPEDALKKDSILVHNEHGSNLINEHKVRRGNVEKGFSDSDFIEERIFRTQHIEHSYMEPETGICIPRPDGVFEIYGSMQHPFSTRRFVANLLGVKLSEVEIIGIPMGGGFGGKDDTAAIVCARVALAAKLLGKPVKMTYKREWSFLESYKRHPYKVYYKIGFTKDGIIKAVDTKILADGGAYCSVTPWVTWRSTVQCCGPYQVENVHCDTFGVYTNNVFTGAMRGFGSPQMNFVIEQMIEISARKCGIDAIEMRRKNMVRQNSVTITGQILNEHTVSLEQVMNTVIDESDYLNKYKLCSFGNGNTEFYGIGLAISYRGMSLGAEGVDFCAAIINVQFDGSVILETGIHENGQGSESAMMIILSQELGIDLNKIRYRRSSTSTIPDSGTTVASRGTLMGGGAVTIASKNLKQKIAKIIAPLLESKEDELIFKNNLIFNKDSNTDLSNESGKEKRKNSCKEISFDNAIKKMFSLQEFPNSIGVFKSPRVSWDEENGQGNAYFTWVYGAQIIELTIDTKSNNIKLINAYAAHDVGKAINKDMVKGQIFGGMAMSAGYALFEKLDIENGRISSLNFDKYKIPRAVNMPEMNAYIIENSDPLSPTGAKGIGEPANELLAPAIANAIFNATGKRYFELPIKLN